MVMGNLLNIQSIKLSDLIDEKFLEDVDRGVQTTAKVVIQKTPLKDLIT